MPFGIATTQFVPRVSLLPVSKVRGETKLTGLRQYINLWLKHIIL